MLFAVVAGVAVRVHRSATSLGRDPCVAFLFVLVGIKFLEARTSRDGTLLVCLAGFLMVTPFFYSQSLLAGVAALPALLLIAAALLQLTVAPRRARGARRLARRARHGRRMIAAGPAARALLLFVFPAPRGAAVGAARRPRAPRPACPTGWRPGAISELSLSDAVAFRVDFERRRPPPAAALLARPRALALRRPRVDRRRHGRGPAATRAPASSRSRYTVTLEPHDKPWLFALDLPVAPPLLASDAGADLPSSQVATLTRDQQLLAPRAR